MKKVNTTVVINGRTFKTRTDRAIETYDLKDVMDTSFPVTLSEVYKNYSSEKSYAYEKWRLWFCRCFGKYDQMHIVSHNCNFFTLAMIVQDAPAGDWWLCVATGRNNYATRIILK